MSKRSWLIVPRGLFPSYLGDKMDQRHAKLRVCASCEWIFKSEDSCPKCGFAHYGARFVYGNSCYRFAITQQPWIDRKVAYYVDQLRDEIYDN